MQSVNSKMAGHCKQWLMPLVFCLSLWTGSLTAGELGQENGVLRSRVYKLKHITSQQAKEMFSQLGIGKSYNTLASDVLILTSDVGSDLLKATELIGVLDQTPAPAIEILKTDTPSLQRPDAFIADLKDMTVGTMMEIPPTGSENPAIIDVSNNKLAVIASEDILNKIKDAYRKWEEKNKTAAPESTAADEMTSEPSTPLPKESSPEPVKPDVPEPVAAAEPNLPPLVPEPNALVEPVEKKADSTPSLEAVARRLLENAMVTDANSPAEDKAAEPVEAATEPNEPASSEAPQQNAEAFLSEALLKELAEAQQQTKSKQPPAEAAVIEKPDVEQPQPEEPKPEEPAAEEPVAEEPVPDETEQDPIEIMRKMLEAAQQEQQAAEQAVQEPEKTAQPEQAQPPEEAGKIQVAEPEPPQPDDESEIQESSVVTTKPEIDPEEEVEIVTMDLPEEVELESLVNLVGKQLGLNYMYEQNLLKNQKVELKIFGNKIKVSEIYDLLELVLRQKGFVMTRHGQLVTIIKANDPRVIAQKGDIPVREPDDPIPGGVLVVRTKFALENISTASAKKLLTELQLGMTNGIQEVAETNTLIVTDYTYRMDQIKNAIEMIDVPGEKKEYKFRTLQYIKPAEIVPKLQDLVEQLEDVSLQISAPAAPAPKTRTVTTRDPKTGRPVTRTIPVRSSTPAAQKPATPDTVFMDTDDRTNRILMIGRSEQVALVNELIDALDVPQYDLKFVREYVIKNVEASDVVDVLNELGLASVSVTPSSTSTRTVPARTTSRTPAARQPTPAPRTTATAPQGDDQPSISIRPSANSLLVNATAEQHKAIELVIAYVDVVQKDQRTIKQYEIQYVDTQEVIDTLTDLGIIAPQESQSRYDSYSRSRSTNTRSSRSTTARTAAPGQPEAEGVAPVSLPTAEGGSEKEITAEQPQISVLETTNSLLVYATPKQHDAIALVIAHADRTPEVTSTPYVVYALENQNPLELADVLTNLIQETVEEVGKASSPQDKIQTSREPSTAAKLPTLEEQKIKIIPDEPSYSLIVYANKRNQQWISELIKELDEYRPQVLLDCTLVEITKQDDFNYDLNVLHSVPDLTYTSGLTGTIAEGITKDDILTKLLDPTSDRKRFIDLQADSGAFTGFYGDEKVMALLTAMQTKDYGRVLANPKLLVDDNKEGSITTTTTTYVTRTTTSFQNTESGDPIQTTNTEFDPYDATITMNITPHISKGENLHLKVGLIRSDFLSVDLTGETPPDQAQSEVNTEVTVPNNSTIILGGMDKINQGKGGDKVPILGDLPLVGGLFRSTSNTNSQSKLYVFVKAHILRPGDDMSSQDLKSLSSKYRLEFERDELEMQQYEDWPGIKPKFIDPEKVLEEDDFVMEMPDS